MAKTKSAKRTAATTKQRASVGTRGATATATPAAVRATLAKLGKTALQAKFKEIFGRAPKSDNVHHLREALAKKLATATAPAESPEPAKATSPKRDKRLPPVGTVIKREYKGVVHEVKVLDDGFSYGGARHRSLSGVAKAITGQETNGFLWFGLNATEPSKDTKGRAAKKGRA